jgi:hypothetical protein
MTDICTSVDKFPCDLRVTLAGGGHQGSYTLHRFRLEAYVIPCEQYASDLHVTAIACLHESSHSIVVSCVNGCAILEKCPGDLLVTVLAGLDEGSATIVRGVVDIRAILE